MAFAATSVSTLLSALGSLGVATFVVAEIATFAPGLRRSVLSTGALVSCTAVGVLAVGSVGLGHVLGRTVEAVTQNPATAAFFVVGAMGSVAAVLFDRAAIGLRRGPAQLTRGITASLLRIVAAAAVLIAGWHTGTALVIGWSVTLAVSLLVCTPMLRLGPADPAHAGVRGRAALVRKYGTTSINHHVLNLSLTAVSYFVPAVAAALLVSQQYAYFATAQTVAVTMLAPTYLLAVALFAEGSRDERQLGRLVRHSLPTALAICTGVVAVAELAAPLVLRLFGSQYAVHGVTALRLLALVGLPYVVKDHYVAIRRAQGRLTSASRVLAVGTSAEALGVVIGGIAWGVTGLCLGWVLVAAVESVLLLPAVLQVHALGRLGPVAPTGMEPAPGARA